jgi:hypothetical protein
MRTAAFLIAVGLIFVILAALAGYYSTRARKKSKTTWADLMNRLVAVDRENLSLVARDLLDEAITPDERSPIELDSSEIWNLIGGMQGLEAMEKNCDVFIDMAYYVQQWHPEAILITEELRHNAREIKWHIDRLRGASATGNLRSAFPDYAQRAVASYYTMSQHLLALFQRVETPLFVQLQEVI